MVGTDRNKQRLELVNSGYALDYLTEWQPKTTLYRHKESRSVDGSMGEGIGTEVKGVPGNPDYVLRKAKIGLFTWPPSDTCECRWCRERAASTPKRDGNGKFVKKK
jgi:hypothetical protein